jgi:NADPH:quinone reductase-like Zn-dependent oxidoreductase
MIWVTSGGKLDARSEMIVGFGRTICSEHPDLAFTSLVIDGNATHEEIKQAINALLQHDFCTNREPQDTESEYIWKDGLLHIGRITEHVDLNDEIFYKTTKVAPELRRLDESPVELTIGSPGLLDTLYFQHDMSLSAPIDPDEVEFSVQATGVNFKDVLIALGQVAGDRLGFECAGVVTRVGSQVLHFHAGDRVVACTEGAYKTKVRCKQPMMRPIPDEVSCRDAVALTVPFVTALDALCNKARLRQGETILIHSAAGGVGQGAIQIAKLKGAIIYATVSSQTKRQILVSQYSIPESHVFFSRDASFAQGVRRMTNDRGVDVILNSLTGDLQRVSWECIAPLGRFIDIGKVDDAGLTATPFSQGATFSSASVAHLAKYDPTHVGALMNEVLELARAGRIYPPYPVTTVKASEIEHVFRQFQKGSSVGKYVVEYENHDLVKVSFDARSIFQSLTSLASAGSQGKRSLLTRRKRHLSNLRPWGAGSKYRTMDGQAQRQKYRSTFQAWSKE